MPDDLIKSIKLNIYERVTSPLLGTFVISWCLWNYRFIMTLLSSKSPEEKFGFIDTEFFGSIWPDIVFSFGGPLIVTLVFIFLYPYPAKVIYKFWRSRQKELKEIRQKIEDETPLTIEESRSIKQNALELEQKYHETLRQKDVEILSLKAKIDELESKLNEMTQSPSSSEVIKMPQTLEIPKIEMPKVEMPKVELTESSQVLGGGELDAEKVEILKYLSAVGGGSDIEELLYELLEIFDYEDESDAHTIIEYHLGEMAKQGLLEIKSGIDDVIDRVNLKHEGRKYLVENGLLD